MEAEAGLSIPSGTAELCAHTDKVLQDLQARHESAKAEIARILTEDSSAPADLKRWKDLKTKTDHSIKEIKNLKEKYHMVEDEPEFVQGAASRLKAAVSQAAEILATLVPKEASSKNSSSQAHERPSKRPKHSVAVEAAGPVEQNYEVGEKVEFFSQTYGRWTATIIKDKKDTGEVKVACRQAWLTKDEMLKRLCRPGPSSLRLIEARSEAMLNDKATPASSSTLGREGRAASSKSKCPPLKEEHVRKIREYEKEKWVAEALYEKTRESSGSHVLQKEAGSLIAINKMRAAKDAKADMHTKMDQEMAEEKRKRREERLLQENPAKARSSMRESRRLEQTRKRNEASKNVQQQEAPQQKQRHCLKPMKPVSSSNRQDRPATSSTPARKSSTAVVKSGKQSLARFEGKNRAISKRSLARSTVRRKTAEVTLVDDDEDVPKKKPLFADFFAERSQKDEPEAKPRGRPKAKTQAQPPSASAGKPSESSANRKPLDSEAKRALQEKIDALEDDFLDKVLSFLESDLNKEGDDENFDLDLDTLPPDRQHQLVQVVDSETRKQELKNVAKERGERTPPDTPPFDPTKESLLTPAVNDTPQFTPQPTPVEVGAIPPLELGAPAVVTTALGQASVDRTPCPTPSPAVEQAQVTSQVTRSPNIEPSPDMVSCSTTSQGKNQPQQNTTAAPANAAGSPSTAAVQAPPTGTPRTSSHAASRVSSAGATRSPDQTREAEDMLARAAKKSAKLTPELRESKTPRQQPAPAPALASPPARLRDSMLDVLDVEDVLAMEREALGEALPGSASGRSGEKA